MEHEEVVKTVEKWLKKEYPPPIEVSAGAEVDIIVNTFQRFWEEGKMIIKTHLQVECKKTDDHRDVAIGQSLRYYTDRKGLFTYLAVPEDYQQFKELRDILEFVDLPIGLILAYYNADVKVVRQAKGKERSYTQKIRKET